MLKISEFPIGSKTAKVELKVGVDMIFIINETELRSEPQLP